MSYFFHPDARVEHLEHISYYESQQRGLGARYLAAFDVAMEKICAIPESFKIGFAPTIRQYRMNGFPYKILFRLVSGDIEVLVGAPHRRRPNYWRNRV